MYLQVKMLVRTATVNSGFADWLIDSVKNIRDEKDSDRKGSKPLANSSCEFFKPDFYF